MALESQVAKGKTDKLDFVKIKLLYLKEYYHKIDKIIHKTGENICKSIYIFESI